MTNTPRLLLAAPCSGAGKTTVTCGLLQALVNRGMLPMACKSGPDYIDPMFHSRIIGAKSGNLDLFFTDQRTVRYLLERNSQGCDVTVLEGAMGFYDGIALSSDASAYDLARTTETPVIFILDARGSSISICAAIHGFAEFQPENHIAGVILNRVSPMFYPRLKTAIEERCGLRVYGYLPELTDCTLESRHLGLVTPSDVANLRDKLRRLAAQAEQSLEIDGLLALARTAPRLNAPPPALPEGVSGAPKIAVARDEAFCFYYEDNLRLLEELEGRLVAFSPLHDKALPACDGLYLGGGYPELHAKALGENKTMREQIRCAIQSGLPTVAECGGFMYLHEALEDADGIVSPMAGVIPGKCYPAGKLGRFGYITLTARQSGLLCRARERIRAHEFHYWESEHPGAAFHASKPRTKRCWDCAHSTKTLYAGFPHLHFYGNPGFLVNFLSAAEQYQRRTER